MAHRSVVPPVQQEPQGSWVGKYGSSDYQLADWDGVGDLSDLGGASLYILKARATSGPPTRPMCGPCRVPTA